MPRHYKTVFLLLFLLLLSQSSLAQKVIEGTVRDAETGETLPSANIVIQDAYRGTITNRDGTYTLTIPDSLLPATLQVRYIGYNSGERDIEANAGRRQDFELQPSVSELEEIVVTGEPGLSIMELVIQRKQQWRSKLKIYKAEAYTRQNLSNDTAIVSITESVSTVYWDDEKGHREVLKWREQTANIDADQNLAGVSYLPNFYDDNVEIAGFDVVGVTHPDALSYYDFEVLEQLTMDGQPVYRIKVIPKRKLQPLFKGEVYVLDEEFALLEVELKPNDVVRFPPPVQEFDLSYSQQFSNYGGDFWLPVDARISGTIKIGVIGLKFPRLSFRQMSKLTDYRVNIPLPDSLYKEDDLFSVDSTAMGGDSLVIASIERVPLSEEEQQAYATLDSTQTLEKAFQPTGFLARFVDFSDDSEDTDETGSVDGSRFNIPGQFAPRLRYNRVDELFGGLKYSLRPFKRLELSVNGGYSTGYNEFSYGGGARYRWSAGRIRSNIGVKYNAQTATRYDSQIINPTLSSISNVLGYENYFDYYRDEGFRFFGGLRDSRTRLSLQAAFNSGEHSSLQTETAFDILGQSRTPRINPAINEGRLNSLEAKVGYNLNEGYSFGVAGRNRIEFNVEYSDDALDSDFDFTRYSTHIDWSFNTFFKRRLFPNTLNISVDAGTFSGRLPLQKFGSIDVAPNIFSPFEGLRTRRFQPYEGEQYAALNFEHNFRTIPFELLGLRPLVERNLGIIVFGGAARSWVSDERSQQIFNRTGFIPNTTDGFHLEAGVSLNSILNLFRVDFAVRLDEPAFLLGVGITRFL
jgi:hypothetical protein